jgi:hypothetical protein
VSKNGLVAILRRGHNSFYKGRGSISMHPKKWSKELAFHKIRWYNNKVVEKDLYIFFGV